MAVRVTQLRYDTLVLDRAPIGHRSLFLSALAGLIVACDQALKHWAILSLPRDSGVATFLPGLALRYRENVGFAFGLLNRAPAPIADVFFVGVPIFALVLIALIFINLRDNHFRTSLALTCILAGALGNLIDRITLGAVIDILEWRLLGGSLVPAFNLADGSILFGLLLAATGILTARPQATT